MLASTASADGEEVDWEQGTREGCGKGEAGGGGGGAIARGSQYRSAAPAPSMAEVPSTSRNGSAEVGSVGSAAKSDDQRTVPSGAGARRSVITMAWRGPPGSDGPTGTRWTTQTAPGLSEHRVTTVRAAGVRPPPLPPWGPTNDDMFDRATRPCLVRMATISPEVVDTDSWIRPESTVRGAAATEQLEHQPASASSSLPGKGLPMFMMVVFCRLLSIRQVPGRSYL